MKTNREETCQTTEAALEWVHRQGMADSVLAGLEDRRRNRQRRILGGAAAALALLIAMGITYYEPVVEKTPLEAIPSTVAVISSSEMKLADGSMVELKNDAELIPAYTNDKRVVLLLKGTAFFQVAKDHDRPFVVVAGQVGVRAVGTAFSVEMIGDAIDVLVTEGRVAVGAGTPTATNTISREAFVSGGECVSVETGAGSGRDLLEVQQIAPAVLADRLSWRIPRLEFTATPLADVVMMFNRHNEQQLVLDDTSLGSLKLSGLLRANNIQALLGILRNQFQIEATREEGNRIVLHARI